MKKLFTILSLSLLMAACQKDVSNSPASEAITAASYNIPSGYQLPECLVPVETALMAGQTNNVGTVTVWNDENNIYVHYQTTGNYKLKKTHLFVGLCGDIPVNNSGNPRIGQYPYQTSHGTTGVQSYTYTIPRNSAWGGCLCVSAHAEIVAYNTSGQLVYSETAWGNGQQINDGGSWAMKFDYCPQDCEGPR